MDALEALLISLGKWPGSANALLGAFRKDELTGPLFVGSIAMLILAPTIWGVWYLRIYCVDPSASSKQDRRWLYRVPLLCLLLLGIWLILRNPGNPVDWIAQLLLAYVTCVFWLGLASWSLPWLGVSARDDVAERRNRPASWAISGALVGLTLCFTSTVPGNGSPTETLLAVLPGILATLALFLLWGILESLTGVSESITVDRDAGAALRLAAFLGALGLLLGQCSTAFNAPAWKQSIRLIAPIALLVSALRVEFWYKRTKSWTFGSPKSSDILVAVGYLVVAVLGVVLTR